jgi:TorA maturation chaperone TorD
MTTLPSPPRPAGACSAAYDLLARAYLNGAAALGETATPAPGILAGALADVDPALPGMLDALILHGDAACESAEQVLTSCFGLPLPGRYVPPVASVYLDGGQLWGTPTHQVVQLYVAEGLSWDRHRPGLGGIPVSSPDHIGVELAFLAVASSRAATVRRTWRITTMLTHLRDWLPGLTDALAEAPGADYPRRLTTFAHSVVVADLRRRDRQGP